jgi:uncharacterized protein (DUF1330 family)
MSLIVVVELTVCEGRRDEFQEFEARALRLMSEFGSKLFYAFRPEGVGHDAEVHVLEFPGTASFASYRNDPRTAAMAATRERVIENTRLMHGINIHLMSK